MFSFILSIVILTTCLSFFSKSIGKKLQLLDLPDKGKIHSTATPIIGGIIIFLSLSLLFIFKFNTIANNQIILIIYLLSFFVVGFFDDKYNIFSSIRILLILIISLIFILLNDFFVIEKIFFENLNSEYYFGRLKIIVTLACILLLYVAMNMTDGINGLVILISIGSIIIMKNLISNSELNLIDITLLSTLITLFPFNYNNKLFLGNSGATILASYFIFTSIELNYYSKIDVFSIISIFLIMGIDMVRLFFLRLFKKKSPFARDQKHFHYILLRKFNLIYANLIYVSLSFFPIVISNIIKTSIIYFVFISIFTYFVLIFKFDN